jgi:serine-type D-Ala-D-Ala carboxypeptidase (penicillin-binding protein 5/6)
MSSRSPFLPPSGRHRARRRRRELARRRRRTRRVLGTALAALALLAAATALVLTRPWSTHAAVAASHGAPAKRSTAASPWPPGPARALSPTGLTLDRPPLALDLADAARDPLHLGFREPPRAGVLIDLDSGRVLWQRDPLARLRIASLTKMMTALLTVKSTPSDARVRITRQAEDTSGSKVGVLPLGHDVRLESLLYGLLLPSGNDAAVALAQHVAGTVHRFVGEMNAEAARLGMGCTRYSSPSGYYNTHNYSCAADLAELAREDLREPRIAHVTRSRVAVLPFPIKGGKLYLYNNNPLLIYGYPGVTGLKTGYTIEAGRCLVATAERHGVRLAVVLLHSPAPGTQARDLLDDAFRNVYHQRAVPEPPMPADA